MTLKQLDEFDEIKASTLFHSIKLLAFMIMVLNNTIECGEKVNGTSFFWEGGG